jgi:two-component system sensor histidine kinase PilS (NtrC family)
MPQDASQQSWFGTSMLEGVAQTTEDSREFVRLWRGFMSARLALAVVMVVVQTALLATGLSHSSVLIGISLAYLASTIASRLFYKPHALGASFDRSWMTLVGLDVAAFGALQLLQDHNINYTPLFALPVLLSAVLGSLRLALGTAAGVTMVLLGATLWTHLANPSSAAPFFVQSALSGVGYFVIALLANQLATRLASEGHRARINQLAAHVQRQVNELVIESLPDGVLIVDTRGTVRAANPAARRLLGPTPDIQASFFNLKEQPGWIPIWKLTQLCMGSGNSHEEDITLRHEGQGPRRLRLRSRLAATQGVGEESLCVLFLQDLRELEARLRTEKLASMGRMSTAVAHEIRNPLAAISQANALLAEDLMDPRFKKLTTMIGQNANRLGKIVDDILNASHGSPENIGHTSHWLNLHEMAHRICWEWAAQNACEERLLALIEPAEAAIKFDEDHLRRVLVNLLDNAFRYASVKPGSIQVETARLDSQHASLSVWSDGTPMDQTVERHLFEPFFSSESRSSGLGLYLCRELCDGHGASIVYQRNARRVLDQMTEGNEFIVTFLHDPLMKQNSVPSAVLTQ